MEERSQLTASEIEEQLLLDLQKRDTQSVTIRLYSGPKGWTWSWTESNRKCGLRKSSLSTWRTVVARLQQQYDLDLSPPPPA